MHDTKNGETAGDGSPSLQQLIDHEGTTFSVANADTRLELESVDTSWDVTEGWERFTLVFDADEGTALEQDTYRLEGGGLDPFDVTLGPAATLDPDATRYEAVFNRRTPDRDAADLLGSSQEASPDGGDVDGPNSTDDASGLGIGMEPYLGTVGMFAGNFAPQGYMICNGTTLQVSQNQALFSLLGTTYGGNGQTTFEIPDLRGRTPIGVGHGGGLTPRQLGDSGGEEKVVLEQNQMPHHTHELKANLPVSRQGADEQSPVGNALARVSGDADIYTGSGANATMDVDGTIHPTGAGMPHQNMSPFLALNYVIAIQGIYPQRP
ncbi:phage tail protein [Natronobeatus ordinarius]|uniref:phage tail protein n=1 Tax=Natronobeatus ordinarius TaxID=2963433 RepID=UPI0020CF642C|nr:tail fiber protein [Natronobeatus ordinarius]